MLVPALLKSQMIQVITCWYYTAWYHEASQIFAEVSTSSDNCTLVNHIVNLIGYKRNYCVVTMNKMAEGIHHEESTAIDSSCSFVF